MNTIRELKQQEKYNMLKRKNKEIERINNIITELEKTFKEVIYEGRSEENKWLMGYYDASNDYLNKLNELKSGDNK